MKKLVFVILIGIMFIFSACSNETTSITVDHASTEPSEPVFSNEESTTQNAEQETKEKQLLFDEANVLTQEEFETISSSLNTISQTYGTDVAALIINRSDTNEDIGTFSFNYFLNNGIGQGQERNGCLLVIDLSGGEWHITTHGETIYKFSDSSFSEIGNVFNSKLSDGLFADALRTYCSFAEEHISKNIDNNLLDEETTMTDKENDDNEMETIEESLLTEGSISENNMEDKVIETIKKYIIDNYTYTELDRVELNEDYGTDKEGDYSALVYLIWNQQNSGSTSKEVLDLYSSDMATRIYEDLPEVQELAIFWTVPYLNNGSAKISFERTNTGMRYTDEMYDKNFD